MYRGESASRPRTLRGWVSGVAPGCPGLPRAGHQVADWPFFTLCSQTAACCGLLRLAAAPTGQASAAPPHRPSFIRAGRGAHCQALLAVPLRPMHLFPFPFHRTRIPDVFFMRRPTPPLSAATDIQCSSMARGLAGHNSRNKTQVFQSCRTACWQAPRQAGRPKGERGGGGSKQQALPSYPTRAPADRRIGNPQRWAARQRRDGLPGRLQAVGRSLRCAMPSAGPGRTPSSPAALRRPASGCPHRVRAMPFHYQCGRGRRCGGAAWPAGRPATRRAEHAASAPTAADSPAASHWMRWGFCFASAAPHS